MNHVRLILTYGSMMHRICDDGFEYYSYVQVYVNDMLSISHDAMNDMRKIDYSSK
jgi:hypothetical protein